MSHAGPGVGSTADRRRRRPRPFNLLAGVLASVCAAGCATAPPAPSPPQQQVLFVCEHGNVKSLMAASYFNQEAKQRGLAVRAISRGSAPDSTTVPPTIVLGLGRDGVDVATFRPAKVAASDVASSQRLVLINTELPSDVPVGEVRAERWSDVPAASTDFAAAREALQRHVRELLDGAYGVRMR